MRLNAALPKAYRLRLLNVLIAPDIQLVLANLGETSVDDVAINRRYLLDNWNDRVQDEVINLIRARTVAESLPRSLP